jgi:hypothetical protein
LRQDCFEQAAIRLNSTDYCVRLTDADRKLSCLKAVSPPCSFEKDAPSTQACQALLYSNSSYCHSNSCYFEFAINQGNASACDQITGERALQLSCQALVSHDPSRCNDDNISTIADYCLQIGAYRLNNATWCDLGAVSSPYRNACYLHFAITEKEPDYYCRKTFPEPSTDECYLNYSISVDNPAFCSTPYIQDSLTRNRCFIYTARNNGDPSACNGLFYSDRKSCYNLVLTDDMPLRDAASCAGVQDDIWRDKCFLAFAQQTHDITQCAQINESDARAMCQSRLG